MKVLTVVGARPQFIKAMPTSAALREAGIEEYMVHTGQHYDYSMSKVFFEELHIPEPHLNLEVGSGSHGKQTARMIEGIEQALLEQKPDALLIYGDTNSTIAGALAAVKLHIPIAHVEAGLRSYNPRMPEEVNRVLSDHISSLLFCPTQTAVDNLAREGIQQRVHLVGDVMIEAFCHATQQATAQAGILATLPCARKPFALATIHRAENTDAPALLSGILHALLKLDLPVVLPLHPRTQRLIKEHRLEHLLNQHPLHVLPPLGYADMARLLSQATLVLTDSGGLQKEAHWAGVPCVTLREQTEWVETLEDGRNTLAGSETTRILALARQQCQKPRTPLIQPPSPKPSALITHILSTQTR